MHAHPQVHMGRPSLAPDVRCKYRQVCEPQRASRLRNIECVAEGACPVLQQCLCGLGCKVGGRATYSQRGSGTEGEGTGSHLGVMSQCRKGPIYEKLGKSDGLGERAKQGLTSRY
jgi:hypothetical protein